MRRVKLNRWNRKRAERASAAFLAAGHSDEPETDLVDLLTDLRHFARAEGVSFSRAVKTSKMHHAAERGGGDPFEQNTREEGGPKGPRALDCGHDEGGTGRAACARCLAAAVPDDSGKAPDRYSCSPAVRELIAAVVDAAAADIYTDAPEFSGHVEHLGFTIARLRRLTKS